MGNHSSAEGNLLAGCKINNSCPVPGCEGVLIDNNDGGDWILVCSVNSQHQRPMTNAEMAKLGQFNAGRR